MRTLGVVGAGQMGGGIAQVAATAGLDVLLHDRDTAFIEKGLAVIAASLRRLADKGTVPAADVEAIRGRIRPAAKSRSSSGQVSSA